MSTMVDFIRVNQSELNTLGIRNGRIIYIKDTKEQYIDISNTERIQISDIVYLKTDEERDSLLAPLPNKIYCIEDTGKLWYYSDDDSEWKSINNKVEYADNAGTVNGHTVGTDVPAGAKFTDTIYGAVTEVTDGLMLATDKVKLNGIEENANNYTHPETHPASMIEGLATVATTGNYSDLIDAPASLPANGGDASTVTGFTVGTNVPANAKFTDTTYSAVTADEDGLMIAADKTKLDAIEANANNYTHPATHPASMIEGLATVATSGKYEDLEGYPTSLPANGGNADTVNNHTVQSDVPADAVFTDTTYSIVTTTEDGLMLATDKVKLDGIETGANNYTHPETHPASMIEGLATVATTGKYTDLTDTPEMGDYMLIKTDDGNVTWNGTIVEHFTPPSTGNYNLGTETLPWSKLYVNAIELDGTDVNDLFATIKELDTQVSAINGKISNVDNTADADKSVKYAATAGDADTVNGFTVGVSVPADAIFTDTTYSAVTTSKNGLMLATDKVKLDAIEANANNYTLPAATASVLGGVKVGSNISYSSENVISLTASNITAALGYTPPEQDTTYSVVTASANGLMIAADKAKLDTVAENANNYTHPTSGVTAGTYNSVTVNANGHVTAGTVVAASAVSSDGTITKSLVAGTDADEIDITGIDTVDAVTLNGNILNLSGYTDGENGSTDAIIVSNGKSTFKDVVIDGNLTINGGTTTIESTTVTTKDNIIEINKGETGPGVTAQYAGLHVDRGTETAYRMVFDETDDLFKVGMIDDLEIIASRPWATKEITSQITSTVPEWARNSTKPTYSKSEVGLANVDNTADANKSVKYATSAGSATSATKATSADTASKLAFGNWTIEADGTNLVFKNSGTIVATMTTSGELTVASISEE